MRVSAVVCAIAATLWSGPVPAQAPPIDDPVFDLGDVIILGRRPGEDASSATTDCIWNHLPAEQRDILSATARRSLSIQADRGSVRLADSRINDDDVANALVDCGGVDQESLLRFVRIALSAYAVEIEISRVGHRQGLSRERMLAAWNALSSDQHEIVRSALGRAGHISDAQAEALAPVIFEVLRRVRPLGVFNPLGYRNGSANHKVVAFTLALATREAMERLF